MIAAVSLCAKAKAAPGVGLALGPFLLSLNCLLAGLSPHEGLDSRGAGAGAGSSTSMAYSFSPPSSSRCDGFEGLRPRGLNGLPLPRPSPLPLPPAAAGTRCLAAPLRTASIPAYSTLSSRPLKKWFLMLISADVALSILEKSMNANLGCSDSQNEGAAIAGGIALLTPCKHHCPRTFPSERVE